jgi:hypothetical protein
MKPGLGMIFDGARDMLESNRSETDDFYSTDVEEYLDLNFGVGTWVRDPFEDRYVVWNAAEETGPERKFIVIDRALRRFPVTIPPTRMH